MNDERKVLRVGAVHGMLRICGGQGLGRILIATIVGFFYWSLPPFYAFSQISIRGPVFLGGSESQTGNQQVRPDSGVEINVRASARPYDDGG